MKNNFKTISVSMDGKLAYFAELLARMQRKTLTRYITELINFDLAGYEFNDELWAEHPADRLALLGNRMPQLLNTRQRILWLTVICTDQNYWLVPLTGAPIEVNKNTFNFALLREVWRYINRNEAVVMDQATAMTGQIKIRRVTHEPGAQWKDKE